MTIVYPNNDHCIPLLRPLYTFTMTIVYLYNDHYIPLQRPLYTFTVTLVGALAIRLNLKGLFCCKHNYTIFRFPAISFSGFLMVKNIYGLNDFWIQFFDAFS